MAKQILNNLETYGVIRNKINSNFTDLYDNKSDNEHTHEQLHHHTNKNELDKIGEDELGKLTYNGVALGNEGVSDYKDLSNKPKINDVDLIGNMTLEDLGIQPSGNYLTEVPSEYITNIELESKGYATTSQIPDISDKLDVSNIKQGVNITLVKEGNNITINSTGGESGGSNVVNSEINGNVIIDGVETNIYTLPSNIAKIEDLHSHDNKDVLDDISQTNINNWNSKSDFSGNYNDLIDKPNNIMTSDVYDPQNKATDIFEYVDDKVVGKLDKTGDTKDNTTTFTEAEEDVDITTGEKHSTIFGKILKSIKTLRSGKIDKTEKGVTVATLGVDGKVPSEQLPPISSSASDITYDNAESGLQATDTQGAIDEVNSQLAEIAKYPSLKSNGNVLEIKTFENFPIKVNILSENQAEKIIISGKNLFNKAAPLETSLYINASYMQMRSSVTNYGTIYIPILGGLTYTISKTIGKSFRVATAQVPPSLNSPITKTVADHQSDHITITTAVTDNYLIIVYYADVLDTTSTKQELRDSIQIEIGAEKTNFENHMGYLIETVNIVGGEGNLVVSAFSGVTIVASTIDLDVSYVANIENVFDRLDTIESKIKPELFTRSFEGKTWLFIGDSITEHNYRSTKNYDQYLEDWLGITALNYGVSSSAYTDNEAGAGWYTKLLANTYPTEVDGIIIMGALNDRHNPVGVYGDNTTATLYGTLKLFYEELISRYPNVPIVTITSTPRDYSYGETATKSGYQNYHEWVDAVIKMSADYSIPCLDLYRLSGLRPWNTTNNLTYFSCASAPNGDGVHPNALGHEIMASKIYDFVIQHMYK